MQQRLAIAWINDLDAWIKTQGWSNTVNQVMNNLQFMEYCIKQGAPIKIITGEARTRDLCKLEIYRKLFYENWTAHDSISRWL